MIKETFNCYIADSTSQQQQQQQPEKKKRAWRKRESNVCAAVNKP
jgi:hypothetical protein